MVSTGRERQEPFARGRTPKSRTGEVVSKGYLQVELRNKSGTESLGPATWKELAKPMPSEREGKG